VVNGGFESVAGGRVVGWEGGVSEAATALVPAVEGGRMARTWHDGVLQQALAVTGGVPVVLRFAARARVPDDFRDMKPVSDRDSPAHRAALRFARGVNFGNNLELPPDSPARQLYAREDFVLARSEGFDHVRLPVAWQHHAGPAPGHVIEAGILAEVDRLVGYALAEGLSVLLDVHHFEEFVEDPAGHTNQLYVLWEQIAAHYAGAPPAVAFEILNEPTKAATTEVMNPIFAEAIRRIRVTNPGRTLFIGTGGFNNVGELNQLLLPDDDANLIATVHTYDPFLFTHQGQAWAGDDAAAIGSLVFPGPPAVPLVPPPGVSEWATNWIHAYNTVPADRNPCGPAAFRATFQFIRQWSEYFGRPVHVGEFGAFESIDADSRVHYYREKRRALEEAGIGWAIWDWKGGFHYQKGGRPEPAGMREALFPPPELRRAPGGNLECHAAMGKTLVVERARRLGGAENWRAVSTQVLNGPRFLVRAPDASDLGPGFYRVWWNPAAVPPP
jgi:endoglucanase